MQISNRLGLSKVWVDAVKFDDYDKVGWRSATGLVAPVQQQLLMARHYEDIEEDVVDRMWLLLGSAVHEVLQRAAKTAENDDASLTEERFLVEFEGKEISLKPDRVELIPGTFPLKYHLKDFKISTVWSVIHGLKKDWECQFNLYAYGLRKIDINVTEISAEVLLKDWKEIEALRNRDYPQNVVEVMPVRVWSDSECETYLSERVAAFDGAESLPDADLPPCTEQERWAVPDKLAIVKKGAKRATKVCSSRMDVDSYMSEKGITSNTHNVEFRPGESKRCEKYCTVTRWCDQYNTVINPPF